jgi:hypothetical protein
MKTKSFLLYNIGYYTGLIGIFIILVWIGLFKFTYAEAKAIEPLVANHFLLSWSYHFLSVQAVSDLIGCAEIGVAIAFVLGSFSLINKKIALIGNSVIFFITLSFLFTTPHRWHSVEGIPVTDFFILKDIVLLSFGFVYLYPPQRGS